MVLALTLSGLAISTVVAPVASATPGPVQTTTEGMVTAEALPTVQIDGVVWSQAIVGNKVFAGGNFTYARPAGSAPGTDRVRRHHILAYDITTGKLDTSFAPVLNGQVRAVSASPDGKYVYVGGDFTTINGSTRSRIAKFDAATGSLETGFLAAADYRVHAIAATNSKVYIGGDFNKARGVARKKLAAFMAVDGALTGWNPQADRRVNALVMSPDNSRVIVGGAFTNLGGKRSYGSGSVDAVAGKAQTWNANSVIRNYGDKAAILGLSTDGNMIFGNGYVYNGSGNLEGAFAADRFGNIKWIEDCHGDTYATYAARKVNVVYTVSHAHYCGNVGGQPDTNPTTYQRAMAFTKSVTGTLSNNGDAAYANFSGKPSPSIVSWFPAVAQGSFTGQNQGPWTVNGNDEYVVMGGEFPRVNGVNQQGLVRFAIQPTSKGTPPLYSGGNMAPSLRPLSGGTVQATVTTNWDRDDSMLTYQLLRNGQVVNSATASSTFWNRPKVSVTDTGLRAGSTYSYQIRTVDSGGNATTGSSATFKATATTRSLSPYAKMVAQHGASAYWRLGEYSGPIYDWAGGNDGTLASGSTRNVIGAITGDGNSAVTFNGTESGRMSTKSQIGGPNVYSVEAWFNTTTTSGGKIVGFGSSATGTSTSYDRHIYMDNQGRVYFGNYVGAIKTVNSSTSYNDGQWHQVVGTLGPSGMVLYVDGERVAGDASTKSAQPTNGYWRVGGDNLDAWTNQPISRNFKGTIDEVSIYPLVLTAQQVDDQYAASGQSPAAAAAFAAEAPAEAAPLAVEAGPEVESGTEGASDLPQGRSGVTDNGETTEPTVDAADPAAAGADQPTTVAADAFERTVAGGFGPADQGGDWTVNGVPADYAVGSGAAAITIAAGSDHSAFLDAVSAADVDATVDVRLDKLAGAEGASVSLIGRHLGADDYRMVVRVLPNGTVTAQPTKLVDGVETALAAAATIPGLTNAAGDTLRVRLAVSGTETTTVNGKVWKVGDTEPEAWSVSAADSTDPLTAGGVGVATALSMATTGGPVVASFDNLAVHETQ